MAEAQTATNKQLNCPICLETLVSPKLLRCLHTFCEKCLYKYVRGINEERLQPDNIPCPVCRSSNPAPPTDQTLADWAAKLPASCIASSLLMSDKSGKDDSTVYCQPCLTDGTEHLSVAYCVTCAEYLCHTCSKYHKLFKATKDHTVTVQCMPESQIFETPDDAMYLCSIHQEKQIYFCADHKEFCCSKCVIRNHRKCEDLSSVEELAKDVKDNQDYKQTVENLECLNKMFHKLLDNRTKHLDSIQQQKTEIRTSINQWTSSVKELVGKLEDVSLEELEQICKQETVVTSDQIVECKSAIAAIEMSQRMLSESAKSDDDTKLMMTFSKVARQLLKYIQKYDAVENRSEEITFEFQRHKKFQKVIQTLSSLGQVLRKGSRISRLSPDSSFSGTLMMVIPRVQPDSLITFNAKVRSDENICNISCGIFLLDEKIVLCDAGNRKIKLFDRCFHFLSCYSMESDPRYICSVDHQTVAVTAGRCIHLLTVEKKLKKQRSIDCGDNVWGCFGITSYQQNILVCVNGDSIFKYDTSYEVIKRILMFERCVVNALCISPDGQSISYTVGNKVVTMDMDGKKLVTFESGDIKGTSGITVDKRGLVYCCGRESGNVILVTPEGRQLGELMKLNNPNGICLNDTNNMICVFEMKSSIIKVLRLV